MDAPETARPWCDALRSILHTIQLRLGTRPSLFFADQLARGSFTWDPQQQQLDFPDLLYRGQSPHHAAIGLEALRSLAAHLGAKQARIPWDSGLYTWASNPEDYLEIDTHDDLTTNPWHKLRLLDTPETVATMPWPEDMSPGLIRAMDHLRFASPQSDKLPDFHWTLERGGLEAAIVMDLLLPVRTWRAYAKVLKVPEMYHPPKMLLLDSRNEELERIWDYLLAAQVVRADATHVEYERGLRLGGDGRLRITWTNITSIGGDARDRADTMRFIRLISKPGKDGRTYDESRPVRIARITAFDHLPGNDTAVSKQPALQAAAVDNILALHRLMARFLTINGRLMAPRNLDRYRIGIVYDPEVYDAIAALLKPGTADAAMWNAMPSYRYEIPGCNPNATLKPLLSGKVRIVQEDMVVA